MSPMLFRFFLFFCEIRVICRVLSSVQGKVMQLQSFTGRSALKSKVRIFVGGRRVAFPSSEYPNSNWK